MGDRKMKKAYDDLSSVYDRERSRSYFKNSLEIILNNIPPNAAVCEVGCGTGMYCIELAKRGYTIKGFDYSEKMIRKAIDNMERQGVQVDFAVADAQEEIPFNDKFDFAISLDSWECFPRPVDVLDKVYRCLVEEGRFIIITPNPYFAPFIILAEKLRIKKLAPAYAHYNSFEHKVRTWAKKTGFALEKKEYSYHYIATVFHLKRIAEQAPSTPAPAKR